MMRLSDFRVTATIPVSNLEQACEWYMNKLGLEVSASNEYQVIFSCGSGTAIQVYESPSFSEASPYTLCTWEVTDMNIAVEELRICGIRFEEYNFEEFSTIDGVVTESDGSKAAWFKDPDGNILCIHQGV
jgi:catechol 2,3-dioxygenase-like lactoylglutathione lyase family enzyme